MYSKVDMRRDNKKHGVQDLPHPETLFKSREMKEV